MKCKLLLQKTKVFKNIIINNILLTFVLAGFMASLANAAPNTINFQAKIKKPDGSNLEAPDVSFRFKYINAAGNCTLYMEDFNNISMAGSAGNVSFAMGNGAKVFPPTATDLAETFSNTATNTMACFEGGNYTPISIAENRKLRVEFVYSGSGGLQALNGIEINSTPYAMYASDADKLAGFAANLYAKFSDFTTCTGGQVLTYNGSVFSCVSPGASSNFTGNLVGDVSGTQAATVVDTVGGKTSSQISTSIDDTTNATSTATASRIVKRDASGNAAFNTAQAVNFSGRTILLYEPTDTNHITIRAPATFAAGDYTITLPDSKGSPGYVLSTDGNGVTSWIPAASGSVTSVTASPPLLSSGGATPDISMPAATAAVDGYLTATNFTTFNNKVSSQWTNNGADIFFNTGNVGIGTTTPVINQAGRVLHLHASGGAASMMHFTNDTTGGAAADGFVVGRYVDGQYGNGPLLWNYANTPMTFATNALERMTITAGGDVGIGTTTPEARLDVRKGLKASNNVLAIFKTTDVQPEQFFIENQGNTGINLQAGEQFVGNNNLLLNSYGGNVGVGMISPAYKLDVAGDVNVSGNFKINGVNIASGTIGGSGTTNKISKFTAAGAIGDSNITDDGTTVSVSTNANVQGTLGVGTTTPAQALEVSGNARVSTTNPFIELNATYAPIPNLVSMGVRSAGEFVIDTNKANAAIANWQMKIGTGTHSTPNDAFYIARESAPNAGLSIPFYISSAGQIGVGMQTPAYAVDVNGDINVTGDIRINGAPLAQPGTEWRKNGSDLYYNNGNVGLGTSTPDMQLHLKDGTGIHVQSANARVKLSDTNTGMAFRMDGSGNMQLVNNADSPLSTFLQSGRVGIGVVAPSETLQVDGLMKSSLAADNSAARTLSIGMTTDSANGVNSFAAGDPQISLDGGANGGTNTLQIFGNGGRTLNARLHDGSLLVPNGSVGIGTETPAYPLHVMGTGTFTDGTANLSITPNYMGAGVIQAYTGPGVFRPLQLDGLGVKLSGKSSPIALMDGNVGIGTENPMTPLEVRGADASKILWSATLRNQVNDVAMGYGSGIRFKNSGEGGLETNKWSGVAGIGIDSYSNATGLAFYTANSAAPAEVMRINHLGQVGIGTTNPAYPLDVVGDIRTSGNIYANNLKKNSIARAVPTTVNDYIEIGNYTVANGGINLKLNVTVSNGSFSRTKQYILPLGFNQTNNIWQTALPVAMDNWAGTEDYDVDVSVDGNTAYLRLRRTSGVNPGTALIDVEDVGGNTVFVATTATGSTTTPANILRSTQITQKNGNVGIGTNAPVYGKLSVVGSDNAVLDSALWGTSAGPGLNTTVYNYSQTVGSVAGIKMVTRDTGAKVWGMYNVSTGVNQGDLAFGSGSGTIGSEAMRINGVSHNVGIGTSAPSSKLEIATGQITYNQGLPMNSGTTQNGIMRLLPASGSYNEVLDFGMNVNGPGPNGSTAWLQSTNNSNLGMNYNLSLNPNGGNVGVGTLQPQAQLNVVKAGPGNADNRYAENYVLQIDAANYTESGIRIGDPGSGYGRISHPTRDIAGIQYLPRLSFGSEVVNSGEYLTISLPGVTAGAAGNVGIGVAIPTAKLEVNGHIGNSGASATLGACGSGSTINGNDTRGKVTMGTGSILSCTINFQTAYSTTPFCTFAWGGASAVSKAYSLVPTTTSLTLNMATNGDGFEFTYMCMQ